MIRAIVEKSRSRGTNGWTEESAWTNGSNASDVGRREDSRGVWSGAGASSDEDNASLL